MLLYSPKETEKPRSAIAERVRSSFDRFFVERCLGVAVRDLELEMTRTITGKIDATPSRLAAKNTNLYSFSDVGIRYEKDRRCDPTGGLSGYPRSRGTASGEAFAP
jgi:hypothetical protein